MFDTLEEHLLKPAEQQKDTKGTCRYEEKTLKFGGDKDVDKKLSWKRPFLRVPLSKTTLVCLSLTRQQST